MEEITVPCLCNASLEYQPKMASIAINKRLSLRIDVFV